MYSQPKTGISYVVWIVLLAGAGIMAFSRAVVAKGKALLKKED